MKPEVALSFVETCHSVSQTAASAAEALEHGAKKLSNVTDKSVSQLGMQLKIFSTTATQLQNLLDDNPPLSRSAKDTIPSALATTKEILEAVNEITKRKLIGERPIFSTESSDIWDDEKSIQDLVRIVATQVQTLNLFVQISLLENPKEHDHILKESLNVKLLSQGPKDVQLLREKSTIADRSSSGSSAALGNALRLRHFDTGSTAEAASIRSGKSASFTIQSSTSFSKMFSSLSFRPGSGKSAAHQKLLFTDLCQACQDGNLGWARNQVSEGADVNSIDAIFNSPLSYAIKRGDLAIVKLLVEEGGARVGGADGRSSAMVFSAVQSRNIPILTYLLDKSAPISSVCGDSKDRGSWKTPLALAVETGQLEAVKLLVEHGADVNGSEQANSSPKGLTPLCTAADRHYPAITELLLQYQARINASESCADWGSFLTALHVASYRGHDDIVDILLSAGADAALTCTTTMPSKTTGVTALHISTGACATKLLASPGASIFARDSAGQFPLSGAVMVRSVESVRTLLGKSAPVNAQNRKGETALHIACRLFAKEAKRGRPDHLKDYRAIAAELVDGGANPGSKKAARIIIITECKKLLAQLKEDGEDEEERERRTYKRGLFETMDAVAGLVEKQAAERKREAFSSNGATADDGPKEVPRRYVAQSSLAFGY